jgi:putative transposase
MASCRRSDEASAPFGYAATGANPTDRGKRGTKRSLLTDGAGIPLALVVDGANRHDVKLLSATLDGLVISRPEPTPEQPQHLCLDAAYDSTPVYQELLARHDQPQVRSRGEEQREKEITPGSRARRWVVERSHSWINRSRRLLVRWEKKVEHYLAFLHLACAQLIFAKLVVFG